MSAMGELVVPLATAALGAGASVYAANQQKKAAAEANAAAVKAAREQAAEREKAAKIAAAASKQNTAAEQVVNTKATAGLENEELRRRRLLGLTGQSTRTGAMQTAQADTGKTKLGA